MNLNSSTYWLYWQLYFLFSPCETLTVDFSQFSNFMQKLGNNLLLLNFPNGLPNDKSCKWDLSFLYPSDNSNSEILSFLFLESRMTVQSKAQQLGSFLLNFEIPDEPPCYVWQCYVYMCVKGCLGVRCCICRCVGALQYTTLVFSFPFFGC